jgi:ankyrin repeat protein
MSERDTEARLDAIELAVERGDLDTIRNLVDELKVFPLNEFINHKKSFERPNIILLAAQHGRLHVLKYLLEEKNGNVKLAVHGRTPLSVAAEHGFLECVKYLIERGANVDPQDREEEHPLIIAAAKDRLDVVQYLLEEKNLDINLRDYWFNTPLTTAVKNASLQVIKYLVQRGANAAGAVHVAAADRNFDLVKYFIDERKGDINELNEVAGETLLHKAARNGDYEMMKYCLERGAKIKINNHLDMVPQEVARNCEEYPLENKIRCHRVAAYLDNVLATSTTAATAETRNRRSIDFVSNPATGMPFVCTWVGSRRDSMQKQQQQLTQNFLVLANACARYSNQKPARRSDAMQRHELGSFIVDAVESESAFRNLRN